MKERSFEDFSTKFSSVRLCNEMLSTTGKSGFRGCWLILDETEKTSWNPLWCIVMNVPLYTDYGRWCKVNRHRLRWSWSSVLILPRSVSMGKNGRNDRVPALLPFIVTSKERVWTRWVKDMQPYINETESILGTWCVIMNWHSEPTILSLESKLPLLHKTTHPPVVRLDYLIKSWNR